MFFHWLILKAVSFNLNNRFCHCLHVHLGARTMRVSSTPIIFLFAWLPGTKSHGAVTWVSHALRFFFKFQLSGFVITLGLCSCWFRYFIIAKVCTAENSRKPTLKINRLFFLMQVSTSSQCDRQRWNALGRQGGPLRCNDTPICIDNVTECAWFSALFVSRFPPLCPLSLGARSLRR